MNTSIAILLGAGSSVAAGFPSTQKLTELVLSGHRVTRHTDGRWYIGNEDEPPPMVLRLVTSMVRRLHAEAECYFSAYAGRLTNYEDIYYLARQAWDELSGEIENPAIRVFVNELKADLSPLVKAANEKNEDPNETHEEHVPNDLTKLLDETYKYIADVVSKSLISHSLPSESQLRIIEHVCKSAHVTSISTLCHDTHVETFLNRRGVALVDGFSESQDALHWNGDFSSDVKTPFLKLHGSVNWFRYTDRKTRRIPPNCYSERIKIGGDILYNTRDDRPPLLLIGTFNKISDYSSGIFLELHYRFRSTISEASTMVICGYSFGDKRINEEIIEWVQAEKGRRFVIIHPNPDILVANARGAIEQNWHEWKREGRIKIIQKRFECVDIAEFGEAISL